MGTKLNLVDYQDYIKSELGKSEWIIVYSEGSYHTDIDDGGYYATLVSKEKISDTLDTYHWDLRLGEGYPSITKSNGETKYYRNPLQGYEPIVHRRFFDGIKKPYCELSEEFRLFFKLYEDRKENGDKIYIHFDEKGKSTEAAKILEDHVIINMKYLKDFLSAKNMKLVIYFDFVRFSEEPLEKLEEKAIDKTIKGDNYNYNICVKNNSTDSYISQGWLVGKKMIIISS